MTDFRTCGHCRWWDATERTAAIEYIENECRKRAPFPTDDARKMRQFPITKGMDTCGDYSPAPKHVYRADYAEELGPWIKLEHL